MDFSWKELRRRKVVRVAVAYAIGAWLLMQVGDTLVGLLELSWVFDITPTGLEKTGPAEFL